MYKRCLLAAVLFLVGSLASITIAVVEALRGESGLGSWFVWDAAAIHFAAAAAGLGFLERAARLRSHCPKEPPQ
jgi:hypothetical protein